MGGFATVAAAKTHKYAAAAPVAAASLAASHAEACTEVPMWLLHGRNDITISFHHSEAFVARLRELGVSEHRARLTLFDWSPPPPGNPRGKGHGSTANAYDMPELFDWMLSYRLPECTWARCRDHRQQAATTTSGGSSSSRSFIRATYSWGMLLGLCFASGLY